jgi:hypothetical protein
MTPEEARKFVKIKLVRDWMGHHKGKEMTMNPVTARYLTDRGNAEYVLDEQEKAFRRPPVDKMVRRSHNK